MPNVRPSLRRNRSAGALESSTGSGAMRPKFAVNRSSSSRRETTAPGDHRVAPPTSMYSMKRSSASKRAAKSSNGTSSPSLTPLMTTVSILRPRANPTRWASARPVSTAPWLLRRVSCANFVGESVSRLTVRRCRPASLSACACSARSTPFVVSATSRNAGFAANWRTSSGSSRRTSGSPPVRRTRSTPTAANRSTNTLSSSNERMSWLLSQTYSSSGMQYAQRRLQRSVTDTRKLRSGRPNVSCTVTAPTAAEDEWTAVWAVRLRGPAVSRPCLL